MRYFLMLSLCFLSSCSHLPPAMQNKAYSYVHLNSIQNDFSNYQGLLYRWGGTIIHVTNEKNASQAQLLFYPLSHYDKPLINKKPAGRFAISSSQFLDPAIYKEGTVVTVTGVLSQQITHQIDKKTLTIPLLTIDHIHTWPRQRLNERYSHWPPYYLYHSYYRYHLHCRYCY